MRRLVRWLYPGLRIKRWMLLFSMGLVLLIFGGTLVLNYQLLSMVEEQFFRFIYQVTGQYNYAILALWGFLLALSGAACMLVSIRKLVKRFISAGAAGIEGIRADAEPGHPGARAEGDRHRRRARPVHAAPGAEK